MNSCRMRPYGLLLGAVALCSPAGLLGQVVPLVIDEIGAPSVHLAVVDLEAALNARGLNPQRRKVAPPILWKALRKSEEPPHFRRRSAIRSPI